MGNEDSVEPVKQPLPDTGLSHAQLPVRELSTPERIVYGVSAAISTTIAVGALAYQESFQNAKTLALDAVLSLLFYVEARSTWRSARAMITGRTVVRNSFQIPKLLRRGRR